MESKRPINLRPHHLLCLRTFVGEGYDEAFVDNMYYVHDRLDERGVSVLVVSGCDDICAACPHKKGDVCEFGGSVDSKDASVLRFLDIISGTSYRASELRELVEEKLLAIEDIGSVCDQCDWSETCNRVLREAKNDK